MDANEMTDAQVRAALTDTQAVALTLWGEARSEPLAGIIAVADVIRNRRRGTRSTWKTVVHRRAQFSCWAPAGGRENYDMVMLLARQLVDGTTIAGAAWEESYWVAEGVIGDSFRPTLPLDTRHYLTTQLYGTNPPKWATQAPGRWAAEIGRHTFLAGVA